MTHNANTNQEFLHKLIDITEENLNNDKFGVSDLANEMGMSRSNLHRKIHALLNMSASKYLRQKRLERSMELLRYDSLTVSEVSYKVGFGSVTYFIKCFHDYYGFPPGELGHHQKTDKLPEETSSENQNQKAHYIFPWLYALLVIIAMLSIKFAHLRLQKKSAT